VFTRGTSNGGVNLMYYGIYWRLFHQFLRDIALQTGGRTRHCLLRE